MFPKGTSTNEEPGIILVPLEPKEYDYDEEEEFTDNIRSSLLCPKLVKDEQPTPNMKLFLIVAWVTFLGEMSRGLVVPVLWPYLQVLDGTIQFLGFVSSGFSFARFFAAPFFGWWSNKRSHKEVMLICLCFLIVGNVIFALYPPPWVLLISRVVVGIGAGTLGQSRGYVSQVTTKEQRTKYVAYLTVSQFAGFAVTPGISILLSYIDFDLFGVKALETDAYSSAGYLLAILAAISIAVVYFFFVDPPKSSSTEPAPPKEKKSISKKVGEMWNSAPALFKNPDFRKILLFSGLIFATRTAVAVVETASSEISQASLNWSSQTLSYYLCGLGVMGTGILMALPYVCKQFGTIGEGLLLCVGVFSLAFGLALMMPILNTVYVYSFVVGLGLTWSLGSALCQTLIISYLSRILNPDSQGAVMGWLASLGSVSRIIGALWTGFALASSGGAFAALGVPSGLMVICLIGTLMQVVQTYRSSLRRSKSLV